MVFHAKTVNMTHNLEVPGSSPGWSTLIISNLEDIRVADFFVLRTLCEHGCFLKDCCDGEKAVRLFRNFQKVVSLFRVLAVAARNSLENFM